MYVRLAFAVAAHLEPEVLIVDEVLAVGDTAFQTKCFGKISEVAGHGRTVLFVSHNMAAVQHLCKKAFLLESGKLVIAGETGRGRRPIPAGRSARFTLRPFCRFDEFIEPAPSVQADAHEDRTL